MLVKVLDAGTTLAPGYWWSTWFCAFSPLHRVSPQRRGEEAVGRLFLHQATLHFAFLDKDPDQNCSAGVGMSLGDEEVREGIATQKMQHSEGWGKKKTCHLLVLPCT